MSNLALERAMGGKTQTEFADMIGASQQLVSHWVRTGKIGRGFVIAIEGQTGVSRHELRPDIFGQPDGRSVQAINSDLSIHNGVDTELGHMPSSGKSVKFAGESGA